MQTRENKHILEKSAMRTSKEYVLQVSTKGFVSQFSFVNPYQHQNILEAILNAATGLIDASHHGY